MKKNSLLIIAAGLVLATTLASAADQQRYTFSYLFEPESELAPRGGNTPGPEITLADGPYAAWKALQHPALSTFERDRQAILAMQRPYRVSFDFLEVEQYVPDAEHQKPYQSWGTEYVYVLEDREDFISLQHILVMVIPGKEGAEDSTHVVKHWRQDWQYQDDDVLDYRGFGKWQHKSVSDRDGRWSQAVYQVDDSPRYEAMGRWVHTDAFSTWESDPAWRPLPRREYTHRDDYHVLAAVNTHTITPNGWTHMQNNLKVAVNQDGSQDAILARELGFNRYELIKDFDFSMGDEYWQRTGAVWADIRNAWEEVFSNPSFTLKSKVDDEVLHFRLFDIAERGVDMSQQARVAEINEIIASHVFDDKEEAGSAKYE